MLNSKINTLNNNHNSQTNSAMPVMVDGIYNYCDRWCEHCLQKQKCSSIYYLEFESKNNSSKSEKDLSKIGEIFALTMGSFK